jgi:hypothetical protein
MSRQDAEAQRDFSLRLRTSARDCLFPIISNDDGCAVGMAATVVVTTLWTDPHDSSAG